MATAAHLPLAADRWTPFVRTMTFEGVDLTGADLRMQVRLHPDTPGAPLVDLGVVGTLSAEGIRLISVDRSGDQPLSVIAVRINETTIEGLPRAGELGADTVLAWDLIVSLAGSLKERWLYGPFTIIAGVTR